MSTVTAKTARLHQRIKLELKTKLRREAHRRHLDETSIVTIALAEYFERVGDPPPIPGEEDEPDAEPHERFRAAAERITKTR